MVFKKIEQLRYGLREALRTGESVAERIALAEVDVAVQTRLQGILIPSFVVAVLFAVAQMAAAVIGDRETLRIAATSIVLAAALYGMWALLSGLRGSLPIVAVWLATRVGPHELARLFLYQLIVTRLREVFTTEEGKPSATSHVVRYALKFSGEPSRWESYALQLAGRIAPRMVAHALLRVVMVIVPVAAAVAYYRLKIFPDVIHAETGLGMWSALIYPLAALFDAIVGTSLRQSLLIS
jgi:hypothetical protein